MEHTTVRPNFDALIFTVAAVFFFASVFLLYDEKFIFKYGQRNFDNLQTIGNMEQMSNDVRRRLSTDFTWFPAIKSETLFLGDSIFAGENSDAKINLIDGGEVVLEQKTLIRLEKSTEQMILNLIAGSLSNTIGKGKSLRVKMGDNIHTITGDGVEVKIKRDNEGALNITVKRGEAKVTTVIGTQTLTKTLTEGQMLSGSGGGSLGYEIRNLSDLALAPAPRPVENKETATIEKTSRTTSSRKTSLRGKRALASVRRAEKIQKAVRKPATIVQAPSNEGWTVKVAAFSNKEEAWNKVNELRTRGLSPYYTVTNDSGRIIFVVNIGLFGAKPDAESFANKLRADLQDKMYNFEVVKAD